MPASAPSVNGHTQAAPNRAAPALSAQMCLLLIVDQVGSNLEFFAINVRAISELRVVQEKFQLIHLQCRRRIRERRHGEETTLRMIGRAPRALPAAVRSDAAAGDARIGNLGE